MIPIHRVAIYVCSITLFERHPLLPFLWSILVLNQSVSELIAAIDPVLENFDSMRTTSNSKGNMHNSFAQTRPNIKEYAFISDLV